MDALLSELFTIPFTRLVLASNPSRPHHSQRITELSRYLKHLVVDSSRSLKCLDASLVVLAAQAAHCLADDWPQFRGPEGQGKSMESDLPTTWSDTENLRWKTRLPGAGSSSPIVVAGKIYLTAYTGYGLSPGEPGERDNLRSSPSYYQ